MSAPRSYVIALGTTPLPRGVLTGRRARRHGRHLVRVASGRTTIIYATSSRAPGAHRANRAANRMPVAVDGCGPGRHRASTKYSTRVTIALPTLLVVAATALFLMAWFSASDAVAFASIVQP